MNDLTAADKVAYVQALLEYTRDLLQPDNVSLTEPDNRLTDVGSVSW